METASGNLGFWGMIRVRATELWRKPGFRIIESDETEQIFQAAGEVNEMKSGRAPGSVG